MSNVQHHTAITVVSGQKRHLPPENIHSYRITSVAAGAVSRTDAGVGHSVKCNVAFCG